MDFFNMDFSKLFLDKHGKEAFDNISNKIKAEKASECSSDYISIVFKTAFLSFFGFEENQIKNMLDDIYKNNQINVKEILNIHSKSINLIKEYLKSNMIEITNDY